MKNRIIRINDEIKKELSEILRSGLKDPRMVSMASVVRVDTSADLKHCKAYISILGSDEAQESCMEAINSAKGYIKSQIASALQLRQTPDFKFIADDSLDYSFKIGKMLDDVNKGE
ncbi:MAG: 30S ribosome-binding factor RbfA [Defluviitaleaceae bacterium]|nr:30S ribosome-binding factor RbfA [Defluviitaleaceae bacterium]